MAREDSGLRLRLPVATHGAVGDDAAVIEGGKRGVERMERQAAGRERVERAPRFCMRMPVAGSTTPEPNSQ
jgi:hypothetical protein